MSVLLIYYKNNEFGQTTLQPINIIYGLFCLKEKPAILILLHLCHNNNCDTNVYFIHIKKRLLGSC